MDSYDFSAFESQLSQEGIAVALNHLASDFESRQQYAELFEVLKLQARHRLAMPVVALENTPPGDATQQQELEQALYQACGRVGELLFRGGKPALAWRYFQLVGDRVRAAELLRAISVTADNVNEIVNVAIDSGVDPIYGLQQILEHQGICNAITTFDGQIAYEPRSIRSQAAEILVDALTAEVTASLRRQIETTESTPLPDNPSVQELFGPRPWLFADGQSYVDVSHLASVVRIARFVRTPPKYQLAAELCEFGEQLREPFTVNGEFPFASFCRPPTLFRRTSRFATS